MIFGVDVHAGYGKIDWNKAAREGGVEFCWAKCSEGNQGRPGVWYRDPQYRDNVKGCKDNGVAVGAYHFAFPLPLNPKHPGRSPREQVDIAFDQCDGLGSEPGDLAPVVDVEWPAPENWEKWGCSPVQLSEWFREYCEYATEVWGRKPVIYTYPWWWREFSKGVLAAGENLAWAGDYLLWMAAYLYPTADVPPDHASPPVPFPWNDWAAWQFSAEKSYKRVAGIEACPVDRNCIRDASMLRRLQGLGAGPISNGVLGDAAVDVIERP